MNNRNKCGLCNMNVRDINVHWKLNHIDSSSLNLGFTGFDKEEVVLPGFIGFGQKYVDLRSEGKLLLPVPEAVTILNTGTGVSSKRENEANIDDDHLSRKFPRRVKSLPNYNQQHTEHLFNEDENSATNGRKKVESKSGRDLKFVGSIFEKLMFAELNNEEYRKEIEKDYASIPSSYEVETVMDEAEDLKELYAREVNIQSCEKEIEIDEKLLKLCIKDRIKIEAEVENISKKVTKIQNEKMAILRKLDKKRLEEETILKQQCDLVRSIAQNETLILNTRFAQRRKKLQIEEDKEFIHLTENKLKKKVSVKEKAYTKATDSFIEHVCHQIEKKMIELECPVCLFKASPPIYRCDEEHIVCRLCRPKLRRCGECRKPYKGNKRHRYAEKIYEELMELKKVKEDCYSYNH